MRSKKFESTILLAVLALIWGSSFILMKKGMISYSASQVASMRILFAGLIFVPYIIKNFKSIPWNKFKYILAFGLLEIGFPPFLYTYAQQHVDSSTAGILNSLVPIFTLSTGFFFFRMKYNLMTTTGVLVGLIGAFIITFFKNGTGGAELDMTNSWGLLIILATLFYGLAGNILNTQLKQVSGSLITAVSFVTLAIPAGIYLFTTDFISVSISTTPHLHSFVAILILAIFGSAIAILLFSKLVKISDPLFASFVTYLIPFVSLIWGWLDGENISIIHFSSLIIIFFGIYLANKGNDKTSESKPS